MKNHTDWSPRPLPLASVAAPTTAPPAPPDLSLPPPPALNAAAARRHLRQLAEADAERVYARLLALAHSTDEKIALGATELLAAYSAGRPTASAVVSASLTADIALSSRDITAMTTEQIAARLAALTAGPGPAPHPASRDVIDVIPEPAIPSRGTEAWDVIQEPTAPELTGRGGVPRSASAVPRSTHGVPEPTAAAPTSSQAPKLSP